MAEQGVVELYDMGSGLDEDPVEDFLELRVRWFVGPQGEDPARMKLIGKVSQPPRLVKRPVARVQEVARGVVDIQKYRMKPSPRLRGVKALLRRLSQGKEIAVDKTAAGVAGQGRPQRDQTLTMPVDHRVQRLHNEKGPHRRVLQCCHGGVAQPQPAHDDIERRGVEGGQTEPGQRNFHLVEQTGHEERLAEFHLEDLDVPQHGDAASAESDFAEGRCAAVQNGEVLAHPFIVGGFPRAEQHRSFEPSSCPCEAGYS